MNLNLETLKKRNWWTYLEEDLQDLFEQSLILISKAKTWPYQFEDYSFIVFPAAKAYEGFLKKIFFDSGFIQKEDYYGTRFRIGKALNPSLDKKYRRESVYDRIVDYCGGRDLAEQLWLTWKRCRNLVFHWFPEEQRSISFEEAAARVTMITEAVEAAFKECQYRKRKNK